MKKLTILMFYTMLCSESIFSAENKSKYRLSKFQNYWDLEILLASEQTKNIVTKEHDGSYSKLDISLLHKIDSNNQLRSFLSTRYIDTKSKHFGNEYELFLAELMYRRKNILTEERHGLYLELEFKNYKIIDEDIKEQYGYDGSFIPQLILSKKLPDYKSLQLKLRRHYFETNNQDNYTLNFEDRIYFSFSKLINYRFLFMAQLKYQHKIRKGNGLNFRFMELAKFDPRTMSMDFSHVPEAKKHQEIVTIHPSISYFINRSNMIEFYVETQLSNTYDKRNLEQITKDQFVFGSALYLTVF